MQIENIQDVINQLMQIEQQCASSKNKAGYFAALYKRMTVAVLENINANNFEDGERMEKLDMIFAQRYLNAYTCYFSKTACSISWKNAFDSCGDDSLIVLQHLLMGINTHINLDLSIAAAQVAPGNAINGLQNDFNRINTLISVLTNDIQECLCDVWAPMRLLMKIANGKQIAVLNFSIDKARDASWSNAVLLANMNDEQRAAHIQQMDEAVSFLGNKIKSPGFATDLMLRAIRVTEYNDVAQIIHLIDTTVVN
ncbi:MAG: DUF5995 family protein [Parafilimonas sp.]